MLSRGQYLCQHFVLKRETAWGIGTVPHLKATLQGKGMGYIVQEYPVKNKRFLSGLDREEQVSQV